MKVAKVLTMKKEPLELDMQLIASELDTSANYLRYISRDVLEDAISLESFDKMVKDIEEVNGVEIESFDDNTIMYEFYEEPIVIHTVFGVKYIIFDSMNSQKFETKLFSYKDS